MSRLSWWSTWFRSVRSRLRGDSGSGVVSILLLFPSMVLFVELIVLGGRIASTTADVQAAAREAARQATLANTDGAARAAVRPTALGFLREADSLCLVPSTDTQITPSFTQGGLVEVEVQCIVTIADLGLVPGVPGSVTITRSAVEPIDTYRAVD